jgi:sulfur carrier protein ThiS adenylyltransferase
MTKEEFFADHDQSLLAAISHATVGIAGAGGLGSNAAAALARSGVHKLVIADFDKVSASNLNRQFFFRDQIGLYKVEALKRNLKRINPFSEYEIHTRKLDDILIQEIFEDVDIIIEAFDQAESKQMLIETWHDNFADIPLIVGSGLGGIGDNNRLRETKSGNLYLIGDGVSDIEHGYKPLAPRVGIVACMQANLALQLLMQKYCLNTI